MATDAGPSSACCRALPAIARASRRCARRCAACVERGVEYLTLFAFSSENWRRPAGRGLDPDAAVRAARWSRKSPSCTPTASAFGSSATLSRFDARIRDLIAARRGADRRQHAADADGRGQLRRALGHRAGRATHCRAHPAARRSGPAPGSARRRTWRWPTRPNPTCSSAPAASSAYRNFLLWQLAYTELYFTDATLAGLRCAALRRGDRVVSARERRFGRTSEQLRTGCAGATAIQAERHLLRRSSRASSPRWC